MAYVLTGVDWSEIFPEYNEATKDAILSANGGVEGVASKCLGQPRELDEHIKNGDIVMGENPEAMLGVATPSNNKAVFRTEKFLLQRPLSSCTLYWSVT